MKKILLPVVAGLLTAMPAFSASISDNYCNNSLAALCVSVNDAREFSETQGIGNKAPDEAIRLITKKLMEKTNINLDKDFEHVGLFVVPSQTGDDVVGFLTGNFSGSKTTDFIYEAINNAVNGQAKKETVTVAGESKLSIGFSEVKVLFLNNNVVLFGSEASMQNVIKGGMPLGKAPQSFNDLMERSSSFFTINGALLGFLNSIPNLPKEVAPLITSVSGSKNAAIYLKDSLLNFDFQFADNEAAEKVNEQFNVVKNKMTEESRKAFEMAKNNLNQASQDKFFEASKNLYAASKNVELANQINTSVNGNSFVIKTPFDKTQAAIGAVGIGAAMAIPNFTRARESARSKACYSNQRVMLGAVEMYNMDHEVMMSELDIDKLVNERYLKAAPAKPEPDCEYYTEGSLTENGKISCKKHGSVPGL